MACLRAGNQGSGCVVNRLSETSWPLSRCLAVVRDSEFSVVHGRTSSPGIHPAGGDLFKRSPYGFTPAGMPRACVKRRAAARKLRPVSKQPWQGSRLRSPRSSEGFAPWVLDKRAGRCHAGGGRRCEGLAAGPCTAGKERRETIGQGRQEGSARPDPPPVSCPQAMPRQTVQRTEATWILCFRASSCPSCVCRARSARGPPCAQSGRMRPNAPTRPKQFTQRHTRANNCPRPTCPYASCFGCRAGSYGANPGARSYNPEYRIPLLTIRRATALALGGSSNSVPSIVNLAAHTGRRNRRVTKGHACVSACMPRYVPTRTAKCGI